ncbi:MAG TPA: AAA family ATPase [Chloroflexota bacterium]|nr:AAA family ATPase [Chloroflexota bacterium]
MTFLRSVRLNSEGELPDVYPYDLSAVATLREIELSSAVTFFAGGNGTGKSTVLAAIAAAANSIPVRGREAEAALAEIGELANRLQLTWTKRTKRGFFLRAEDFFGYKRSLNRLAGDIQEMAEDYDRRYEDYGRILAVGSALGQRNALVNTYDGDLSELSHGESFLRFFGARFNGQGLYLLDEPDTALSAQSILGLVVMLREMVEAGAQLIIATHSPILLALPGATLFSFDRTPVEKVRYDDLEQVALTRDILNHPQVYFQALRGR